MTAEENPLRYTNHYWFKGLVSILVLVMCTGYAYLLYLGFSIVPTVFLVDATETSHGLPFRIDQITENVVNVQSYISRLSNVFALFASINLLLIPCFLYLIYNEPRLLGAERAFWVVSILFFHVFAIPVYWVKYGLRSPPEDDSDTTDAGDEVNHA